MIAGLISAAKAVAAIEAVAISVRRIFFIFIALFLRTQFAVWPEIGSKAALNPSLASFLLRQDGGILAWLQEKFTKIFSTGKKNRSPSEYQTKSTPKQRPLRCHDPQETSFGS
jgi:hypothetical protein